jgi:Right handed beta helix region
VSRVYKVLPTLNTVSRKLIMYIMVIFCCLLVYSTWVIKVYADDDYDLLFGVSTLARVKAYSFTYTFGDGDYYTGIVYASGGYGYYQGYSRTKIDARGNTGTYSITAVLGNYNIKKAGQVYILKYYSHETDKTYNPVGGGTAVGTNYLGSEYGYIIRSNVPGYYFGGGYYEANVSALGSGAVYYVDSTGGNDSNTGFSPGTAWKTISKVNGKNFNFGDSILFKRGETWQEGLKISSSGSLDNPITYSSYGSGVNPLIDASNVSNGIDINLKNYITINGLDIINAQQIGIVAYYGGSEIVIMNCKILNSSQWGIKAYSDTIAVDGWAVINNEIAYNQSYGFEIINKCTNWNIEGNSVHGNCSSAAANFTAGIKLIGATLNNITVQNNQVYANGLGLTSDYKGAGIWLDTVDTGCIIRYNEVYNNNYYGILNEATSTTSIYYNICYNNRDTGISISRNNHNCQVYNNVCYANKQGISVVGDFPGQANNMVNNMIKNNISFGNTSRQLLTANGGENDGRYGYGNIYEYNCFGQAASNFIEWGNGGSKSTYPAWEISYGRSTHSVQVDPQLTNPASSDFRLQSASPCINAGVNVGLTQDFFGNAVPRNGGPDVGAAEY